MSIESLGALAAPFAPTGTLRVAINLGNPLLASLDADRQVRGLSVDLAHALAQALGLGVQFCLFDTAAKSVEAVTQETADVGFFAIDPVRGAGIRFTSPYLLIEGSYLVRADSPLQRNDEVDRAGHRIVVGAGSAYDLHLTREIGHASLLRAPSSPAVVDTFLASGAEVAAGVRQQLQALAAQAGGLRLLDGHFMLIRQAMGCPRGRPEAVGQALTAFIEARKADGFVADAMRRHGISGASLAPAGG